MLGYLVFAADALGFRFEWQILTKRAPRQTEIELLELFLAQREQVPLNVLDGIVNIETQLLEIRDNHIPCIAVLALVAERLTLHMTEVCSLMIFQFYNTDYLAVSENSSVGFLGVGLVLLLGDEVIVRSWVQYIAKHLDEQFTQETLLKLFLFGRTDILLNSGVKEIRLVRIPRRTHLLLIQQGDVLLYDSILKEHGMFLFIVSMFARFACKDTKNFRLMQIYLHFVGRKGEKETRGNIREHWTSKSRRITRRNIREH